MFDAACFPFITQVLVNLWEKKNEKIWMCSRWLSVSARTTLFDLLAQDYLRDILDAMDKTEGFF